MAYDTQYAMVDRQDDLRMGIKSTAILLGTSDRLGIAALQGLSLLTLFLAGRRFELGGYFYGALLVAAALFAYQQYLIRDRHPDACLKAFKNNTWVGLALFIGIALHYDLLAHLG